MTDHVALVECYRTAAVAIDEYLCGFADGRSKRDPVYQYVVEGRDVPATYQRYSSCGDRAHARYWRLGCRLPFVNREERTPAPHDWRSGWNIILLHDVSRGAPCMTRTTSSGSRIAVPPGADWVPKPGEEMLVWNSQTGSDAHSLSVLGFDGKVARTANYGAAGMSAASFPGAKITEAPLAFDGRVWRYGSPGRAKVVQRVSTIESMVPTFTEPPNLCDLDGVPLLEMSRTLDEMAAARAA